MIIDKINKQSIGKCLSQTEDYYYDFIVFITGVLEENDENILQYLNDSVRILNNGGVLIVQGKPNYLPKLGVYLDRKINFKYWIAIQSKVNNFTKGLPSVHASLLMYSKGKGRFNIKRTRFPHQYCQACGRTLKDWGGKTHLMNPEGYVISDVWKDLPKENNYTKISNFVYETILNMLDFMKPESEIRGLIIPKEGLDTKYNSSTKKQLLGNFERKNTEIVNDTHINELSDKMVNVIIQGDAVETLRNYPDNCIDLVFADPPYNLDKKYNNYDDELDQLKYIDWCNSWLIEYSRILKPTGSLFLVNLPRWTMYHASFLNKQLYFQNWIVWDAMSEPRGKLMPAHYGLLFYTKHPSKYKFYYDEMNEIDDRYYCLRKSCIKRRKAKGKDKKMPLTDIWWDIHRIRHKRDRDYHPCQLPIALMERIILLSTDEGDIVLDALSGSGTTAVAAAKLNRSYIAIDIDKKYIEITKTNVANIKEYGILKRESIKRKKLIYTKKELQIELRNLAKKLERLPSPDDVKIFSDYDIEIFFQLFPTWGKALKAAKLEINNDESS